MRIHTTWQKSENTKQKVETLKMDAALRLNRGLTDYAILRLHSSPGISTPTSSTSLCYYTRLTHLPSLKIMWLSVSYFIVCSGYTSCRSICASSQ